MHAISNIEESNILRAKEFSKETFNCWLDLTLVDEKTQSYFNFTPCQELIYLNAQISLVISRVMSCSGSCQLLVIVIMSQYTTYDETLLLHILSRCIHYIQKYSTCIYRCMYGSTMHACRSTNSGFFFQLSSILLLFFLPVLFSQKCLGCQGIQISGKL